MPSTSNEVSAKPSTPAPVRDEFFEQKLAHFLRQVPDFGIHVRKTMRIGEVRTSIKLEPEFWSYLKEVAEQRSIRLSRLVNDVAQAAPERTNLASTLRTFCLVHARWQSLQQDVEQPPQADSTRDLTRMFDAYPLPCLVIDRDRIVRRLNRAFSAWLNVDPRGVVGQRLDQVMIVRGQAMQDLWRRVYAQPPGTGRLHASYVSFGNVRTSHALAMGLTRPPGAQAGGSALVMFEILPRAS